MKRVVIDASVVIKLFFEEEHSAAAERSVRQGQELLAPDLIWAEAANVIWKRQRRGDLSKENAAGQAYRVDRGRSVSIGQLEGQILPGKARAESRRTRTADPVIERRPVRRSIQSSAVWLISS